MADKESSGARPREPREYEWTEEKRDTFLAMLAATAHVGKSCRAAGRTPSGLYRLRLRDPTFAERWDAALDMGLAQLKAMLIRRAAAMPDGLLIEEMAEAVEKMDTELAVKLLGLNSRPRPDRHRRPRQADQVETDAAIKRLAGAIFKRRQRTA